MKLSQVKRWLNQTVRCVLPHAGEVEMKFTACRLLLDEHTGEYRYLAELLDTRSGRSVVTVELEKITPKE